VLWLDGFPVRGNYTIVILLNAPTCIQMSKKGQVKLDKGYYAYTGSALGHGAVSLRRRVARHFKKTKRKHWHIDNLLAVETASIRAVVAAPSIENRECKITDLIKNIDGTTIPIIGFGASDCKHNCKSHLVQLGQNSSLEKIVDVYKRIAGKTQVHVYKL